MWQFMRRFGRHAAGKKEVLLCFSHMLALHLSIKTQRGAQRGVIVLVQP